ncbi:hypothetical protein HDU97_000606 [Phlyctochytrium planicorne]|nr:hypothetical protein HDU97_000606 [Phlyctochytrium planicorne]
MNTATTHTNNLALRLPIDLWTDIMAHLPIPAILRLRFLSRTILNDIFPLAFLKCLRNDARRGHIHADLKADGFEDGMLRTLLLPTRFARADGGRYVFERKSSINNADLDGWLPVDVMERDRCGMPFWAFALPFWFETFRKVSQDGSGSGAGNYLRLLFAPKSDHQMSSLLAQAAKQKWLDYHANIITPYARRHFVPLHDLAPGIHHTGGGGLICTYEILDHDDLSSVSPTAQTSFDNNTLNPNQTVNVHPKRFVRIVKVTVSMRWILSGMDRGTLPIFISDSLSNQADATSTAIINHLDLPSTIFSDALATLKTVFKFLHPSESFEKLVDTEDPRVLAFLEASATLKNVTALAQSLVLSLSTSFPSSSTPGTPVSPTLSTSTILQTTPIAPVGQPANIKISTRRFLLQKRLESTGINPDIMWTHGFSRRWIASGNFDGPCPDGIKVAERLVGTAVEIQKLKVSDAGLNGGVGAVGGVSIIVKK